MRASRAICRKREEGTPPAKRSACESTVVHVTLQRSMKVQVPLSAATRGLPKKKPLPSFLDGAIRSIVFSALRAGPSGWDSPSDAVLPRSFRTTLRADNSAIRTPGTSCCGFNRVLLVRNTTQAGVPDQTDVFCQGPPFSLYIGRCPRSTAGCHFLI